MEYPVVDSLENLNFNQFKNFNEYFEYQKANPIYNDLIDIRAQTDIIGALKEIN